MNCKKKYLKYKQKYLKLKLGGTPNRLNRPNKMKIVDKKTKVVVECDEDEINRKNDTELYVLNKDINGLSYEQQLYKKFNTLQVPNMNEINLRKNKKTKYEINILTLSTHNLGGQTIIVEDEQKEYVNPNRGIVTQKYDTNLEFIRNNLPKANNYGIPLFRKYNIPQHKPDICFYQEYQHQNIDLNTVNQNNLRYDIYNDELFVERQKDLAFRIGGDDIVSENNSTWERGLKRFYRCPLKLNINDNGYILNIEIFNFHGGIFSESTSLSQLKSNLKILSFIAYNNYPIIVAGDFNIDLLKEDYIIEYYDLLMSKKKNVRDYISKEINFIETLTLIRKKIHNNYKIYPKTQIRTNTWSLNHTITNIPSNLLLKKEFEIANKCVDYILIPKKIEPYIIDERVIVDSNVMATAKLHQQEYTAMGNDFDHSIIYLDLIFNKDVECKLIPI